MYSYAEIKLEKVEKVYFKGIIATIGGLVKCRSHRRCNSEFYLKEKSERFSSRKMP